MRNVSFSVMALLLVLALRISPAAASFIYEVDLSVGIDAGSSSPGTVTATGTVEVDMLGVLAPANFIDWSIDSNTIGVPPVPTITLTPSMM